MGNGSSKTDINLNVSSVRGRNKLNDDSSEIWDVISNDKKYTLKISFDPKSLRDSDFSEKMNREILYHSIKNLYEIDVHKNTLNFMRHNDICDNFVEVAEHGTCAEYEVFEHTLKKANQPANRFLRNMQFLANGIVKVPVIHDEYYGTTNYKKDIGKSVRQWKYNYIIQESLPEGRSFSSMFINSGYSGDDLKDCTFQILYTCFCMSQSGVLHNNINANNIYIVKRLSPVNIRYSYNGKSVIFKSSYKVYITDFVNASMEFLDKHDTYPGKENDFLDNKDAWMFCKVLYKTSFKTACLNMVGGDTDMLKKYFESKNTPSNDIISSFNSCEEILDRFSKHMKTTTRWSIQRVCNSSDFTNYIHKSNKIDVKEMNEKYNELVSLKEGFKEEISVDPLDKVYMRYNEVKNTRNYNHDSFVDRLMIESKMIIDRERKHHLEELTDLNQRITELLEKNRELATTCIIEQNVSSELRRDVEVYVSEKEEMCNKIDDMTKHIMMLEDEIKYTRDDSRVEFRKKEKQVIEEYDYEKMKLTERALRASQKDKLRIDRLREENKQLREELERVETKRETEIRKKKTEKQKEMLEEMERRRKEFEKREDEREKHFNEEEEKRVQEIRDYFYIDTYMPLPNLPQFIPREYYERLEFDE